MTCVIFIHGQLIFIGHGLKVNTKNGKEKFNKECENSSRTRYTEACALKGQTKTNQQ